MKSSRSLSASKVVRGEAQPQVPVHVRALVLLGLHGVEELQELRHVGLGDLRLHPAIGQVREARVADHVARVARDHQAAGVPLVRGQHQRLIVDHDELALVRPAVPLQEDPGALVAQQPQLRAAVGGRAVVGHLQLAPARPVLRQERSSEKSEVLVTASVLEAKSCGAETVPELVTSPQTTLPVDTPPLVAVKVQSRLSQSSGPAEAAPVMVSVAPERPGGCEARRGCCARGRQRARGHVAHRGEVPGVGRVVDGECAARDSCGGAQQAHAGRAADATASRRAAAILESTSEEVSTADCRA